jgi:hypothetical protein
MIKILLATDYLLVVNFLASLALFLHCVFALNRMTHRSNHLVCVVRHLGRVHSG